MALDECEEGVLHLCARLVREGFENHDVKPFKLKPFEPKQTALFNPFIDSSKTLPNDPSPQRPDYPSLLLYDLENESHKEKQVFKHIHDHRGCMTGLYGTSGAGKTRSAFEYLSKNFGLYFVADTTLDAGSQDLTRAIPYFYSVNINNRVDENINDEDRKKRSLDNFATMTNYMYIMVFVRNLVFKAAKEKIGESELTPHQWLLMQLYPEHVFGKDIFADVSMEAFGRYHDTIRNSGKIDVTVQTALPIDTATKWNVIVVDETQKLKEKLPIFFLSEPEPGKIGKPRDAFAAVLRGLELLATTCYGNTRGHPVFAGTGMSAEDFQEAADSTIAKGIGSNVSKSAMFQQFEPFTVKGVESYMSSILNFDGEDVDDAVLKHVCKWLRGRPRWTASFLEAYMVRNKRDYLFLPRGQYSASSGLLLQALERYLVNYTINQNSARGKKASLTLEKGSPFVAIKDAIDNFSQLREPLERAVFKFAVGGNPAIIEEEKWRLIKKGIAAIRVKENGTQVVLDEPIMVEAGINYFTLKKAALTNLLQQETSGQGDAFEKVMLPAIQEKLPDLLASDHAADRELWSKYKVSNMSAYGVLAVDCKKSIKKTLKWLEKATSKKIEFEGQIPPFCYPDNHFGPDLIFLMWNQDYTDFLVCISQAKFRKDFNQMSALRTITPSLLYHQNRDAKGGQPPFVSAKLNGEKLEIWNKVKPKVLGDKYGCVRLMVQYPQYQVSSAEPGPVEDSKPNVQKRRPDEQLEKKLKTKLGWLSTVHGNNANTFFGPKVRVIFDILKGPDGDEDEDEDEEATNEEEGWEANLAN